MRTPSLRHTLGCFRFAQCRKINLVVLLSNLRVLMASLVLRERLVPLDPREMLVLQDPLDLSEVLDLR